MLVLLLAAVGCRQQENPAVLARAGQVHITENAFRDRYVAYLLQSGLQDDPLLRRRFLEEMIASQLLVREAQDGGIEKETAYQERKQQLTRKLLIELYMHHTFFDTLGVREAEVRDMFVRAHTQLQARHLYARTRADADTLLHRLRSGASFEELAREVFQDPDLHASEGALGTFGLDEMDAAFEDAAFALSVGGISEPVRTAQGYSIIRLEDRFSNPLLTETEFARKRPQLEAYTLRRKRQQLQREHVRWLVEDADVKIEEDVLTTLLGHIVGRRLLASEEEMENFLLQQLLHYGSPEARRMWTVGDFREQAERASGRQRAQVRTRQDLIDFVMGLVGGSLMLERAQEQELETMPVFEEALTKALNDYVLDRILAQFRAAVTVPEDSIRAYFDHAPRTEFLHEERIHLAEMWFHDRVSAEKAKADPPEDALRDRGYVSRSQLDSLQASLVFFAAEGEIVGPFAAEGAYVLFEVGERREAGPMTYEEAHASIQSMLHYRYTRDYRREVYNDVQGRYTIETDRDLLSNMQLSDGT